MYSGYHPTDVTQGHTWILDGYDGESGLFHFNWGWGGYSNGFFALSVTGDNISLYPSNQGMIINIFPASKDYSGYSKLYVEYPHRFANFDAGQRGGLTMDCEEIKRGEPFKATINNVVIPPATQSNVGIALIDRNEKIKEISSVSGISGSGDMWTSMTLTMNCRFDGEILPTDYIQVVEVSDDSPENYISSARIITGAINAPSCIPVCGNKPNTVDIRIICDDDVIVRAGQFSEGTTTQYRNGDVIKAVQGSEYVFELAPVEIRRSYGIVYNIYDCYRKFNQVFLMQSEVDNNNAMIRGSFRVNSESTTFKVNYLPITQRTIELALPGTLIDEIGTAELAAIGSMKLSGKINAQDIWYIGEHAQSLKELDMSEAVIVSSDNVSVPDFGDFIPAVQEDNKLPDYSFYGMKRLRSVKLPNSIEIIGRASFMDCDLSSLRIPSSVRLIYAWLAANNTNLMNVYCESETPPQIYSIPLFNGTECLEKGTLFVPAGTVELYRGAQYVWNDFKSIKEEIKISGIDDVAEDTDTYVRIYNLQGILVFEGMHSDATLGKGVYIIVSKDKTYKQLIK